MRTLSLGWLTLANANNEELIMAAADAGFNAVGLRAAPKPRMLGYGIATQYEMSDAEVGRVRSLLTDHGMKALHIGAFWLDSQVDIRAYEHHLAQAQELGARMAIAIATPSMLRSEIVDGVAQLAVMAESYGVRIAIEFAVYTGIKTLEQADEIARNTACGNVGILIDALHLYRSGGTALSIGRVPPERIFMAQICDGPMRSPLMDLIPSEARFDRRDPGEGQLPLSCFLNALPPDTPLEVEVPKLSSRDISHAERARICYQVTHQILNSSLNH